MSLCLTYLGQEEARRVVLHQEGLGAHVDSDLDLLALFNVGAVLLVDAQDLTPAVIHRAEEAALTWCADPVVAAGIHRALDDAVIRHTAKNSRRNDLFWIKRRGKREHSSIREQSECCVFIWKLNKSLKYFGGNSPPYFDKGYFADTTAVPGPRAAEVSTEVLSGATQILFLRKNKRLKCRHGNITKKKNNQQTLFYIILSVQNQIERWMSLATTTDLGHSSQESFSSWSRPRGSGPWCDWGAIHHGCGRSSCLLPSFPPAPPHTSFLSALPSHRPSSK